MSFARDNEPIINVARSVIVIVSCVVYVVMSWLMSADMIEQRKRNERFAAEAKVMIEAMKERLEALEGRR